jgi:outer membrane immunogenic protein
MRLLVRGLLLAGVASPAFAADIDNSWLRGSSSFPADPPPYQRWSGVYGGGQMSADFHGVDFRGAPGNALANIQAQDGILQLLPLSGLPALPSYVKTTPGFGGFLGYNYQIDDVVLGAEASFNWSNTKASASDSQSRSFIVTLNNHTYAPTTVTVTNQAAIVINDYGSVRARAGWAYGSFLPYVFAGVSVAQVDSSRSVNVNYFGIDQGPNPPLNNVGGNFTQGDQSHGKYTLGFSGGLGVDYALSRSLFLRGEIEYLNLGAANGIKLNTTSARAGAGVKF